MRAKRFTVKTLRDLWIKWLDDEDVNAQELYRKMNLKGSFVVWLEKRERVEKLMNDMIRKHKEGTCKCNLTYGGHGICYAGQYLKGLITVDQVIGDRWG